MAGRIWGTVRSWKDRWGFLVSDAVDGDIFVHARENPNLGGTLQVGEQVMFELIPGKDGQPHAINVERPGGAEPASSSHDGTSFLQGTLASFRDGWGLIESASLPEKLWCGIRDNPQINDEGIVPGDEVTFEIGINSSNGRNKAVSIALVVREQSELVGRRVRGVVNRFNDGWGFATSSKFRGTIMLGKKNVAASGLSWLQVGTPVEFEIAAGQAGKFEAINLSSSISSSASPSIVPYRGGPNGGATYGGFPANGGAPAYAPYGAANSWGGYPAYQAYGGSIPAPGYGGVGARDRSRTPQGGGHGALPTPMRAHMAQAPLPPPPLYKGAGKGFATAHAQGYSGTMAVAKDGWGWVRAAGVEGDIFLGMRDNAHLSALPVVGDELTFELALDPKSGRYKAISVAHSQIGKRVQGTVSSIRDGGGWGFAKSDGVDGDAMLGKRSLRDAGIEVLHVGDVLEYALNSGAKGYEGVDIIMISSQAH